jgi:hypothetical protein
MKASQGKHDNKVKIVVVSPADDPSLYPVIETTKTMRSAAAAMEKYFKIVSCGDSKIAEPGPDCKWRSGATATYIFEHGHRLAEEIAKARRVFIVKHGKDATPTVGHAEEVFSHCPELREHCTKARAAEILQVKDSTPLQAAVKILKDNFPDLDDKMIERYTRKKL